MFAVRFPVSRPLVGDALRTGAGRRTCARQLLLALAGLLLQLFAAHAVLAYNVICVHDAAGLDSAIGTAGANDDQTVIKIEKGTYQMGGLYAAFKNPVVFAGDYVPGTNCAQRGDNSDTTIIDFGGPASTVYLRQYRGSPHALIKFDRLTLRNGKSLTLLAGDFETPPFLGQGDYPGFVTMVHVHVTGFSGGGGDVDNAAVSIIIHNGNLTMTDVLFDHLSTPSGCAISVLPWDDDQAFLDHVTMDLTNGRDFCMDDTTESDDKSFEFDNSIVWSSDGSQSTIYGGNSGDPNSKSNLNITLNNTLSRTIAGQSKSMVNNHPLNVDPMWVNPAAGNYRLQIAPKSPAINAGTTKVPGGEPVSDLDGNTRVIGSAPDLGAYESPSNDADTFTVTNTNDSGPGSLRAAMTLANASSAPATSILFSIGGSCPAVINLLTPLPSITVPMQIDGYTQPGSIPNQDAEAFDATLCVAVQPGAGFGLGAGFRVPVGATNASLAVSGIGFGSFYRSVWLQDGNQHRILGNQFGGSINGGSYELTGANGLFGSNNAAIYVDMPAAPAQVQIGADEPADRNAIQYTVSQGISASAIFIASSVHGAGDSCQIDGNLVGVTDDGMDTAGNDHGLMLEGSGCVVHANRFAGNNYDAIWINGGSGNTLRNNTVGLIPYGFNLAAVNGGVGIRVEGDDNVIGGGVFDSDPGDAENTVEFMQGPGIVIQSGANNSNRGNTVVYNNNGIGTIDVDIDDGTDGATPNDLNDADGKQNFPILHTIAYAAPPVEGSLNVAATISGVLSSQPGQGFYQIEAYYSDDCSPISKRGSAQILIGSIGYVYIPQGANTTKFSIPVTLPAYSVQKDEFISVMATDNTHGNGSSELSACLNVDTIFKDGAEVL